MSPSRATAFRARSSALKAAAERVKLRTRISRKRDKVWWAELERVYFWGGTGFVTRRSAFTKGRYA